MRTVTTAEARESLPELLQQIEKGPVLIRDNGRDVAVLVSSHNYEDSERSKNLLTLKRLRDEASEELRANLAKEGISPEEFLADLLGS